jgi:Holliday junction resolvase
MGKKQRIKGSSFEREMVNRHKDLGVDAKRVPLSGATDFAKHDVIITKYDVMISGISAECKIRANGFKEIYKWLEENPDILFCRADRKEPFVVVPWTTWIQLLKWSKIIKVDE